MAVTDAGAALTEAHRQAQVRLAAETVQLMRILWPLLDPENLDATVDRWLRSTIRLVGDQRARSARLAAEYFRMFRSVEIGESDFAAVLADQPPPAMVATSLIVTGPVAIKRAMTRLVPLTTAVRNAEALSSGAAIRHVLNGGRDTLDANIRRDRRSLGFVRVTDASPCWFCAMLASRGPVYKAESFSAADARFQGFGAHKVHDNCGCMIEPVFSDETRWPGRAREFRELWNEVATRKLRPDLARDAFREAYEARA